MAMPAVHSLKLALFRRAFARKKLHQVVQASLGHLSTGYCTCTSQGFLNTLARSSLKTLGPNRTIIVYAAVVNSCRSNENNWGTMWFGLRGRTTVPLDSSFLYVSIGYPTSPSTNKIPIKKLAPEAKAYRLAAMNVSPVQQQTRRGRSCSQQQRVGQ